MEERNYCVYSHVNKVNGKQYIGITNNPERRWKNDGYEYKNSPKFWRAICKYGWDNFEHNILFSGMTFEEACEKEIELIALYRTQDKDLGYNIASGGNGGRVYEVHPRGMSGKPQSEHQKQVLRELMSNPETNHMMNGRTVFGKTLPHPLSKHVKSTSPDGEVKTFYTIKECGEHFGLSKEGMRKIINKNKIYYGCKKELHGYKFEYLPKGSLKFIPREGEDNG